MVSPYTCIASFKTIILDINFWEKTELQNDIRLENMMKNSHEIRQYQNKNDMKWNNVCIISQIPILNAKQQNVLMYSSNYNQR